MSYNHLCDQAREVVCADARTRLRFAHSERWIGYTRAVEAVEHLEWLYDHPPRSRMPNMLICAPTNNGKTTIAKRFLRRYPSRPSDDGEHEICPVLFVDIPHTPDPQRLYHAILATMNIYLPSGRATSAYEAETLRHLRRMQTRMLFLDDLQNLLAGSIVRTRQSLNLIRFIGNALQIPIVALGTQEALQVMQADPQTANRFEVFPIPLWKLDDEYLTLLDSFEKLLPLRMASGLSDGPFAARVHTLSEGFLGEIAAILLRAFRRALKDGQERITLDTLDAVRFVPPSRRRVEAVQALVA